MFLLLSFAGGRKSIMIHFAVIWLFCIVILVPSIYKCENIRTIKIATYNVWNIMFNWDVRKFHIAQMIREIDADVIAFQELRADGYDDVTQLDELQDLLPTYRWQHFAVAQKVAKPKDTYVSGMDFEGIGILSRLPIVRHEVQNLTTSPGSDSNERIVLHVQILLDDSYKPDKSQMLNVAAVHFSYDRQQQCSNAIEVLRFLRVRRLRNVVVLGDFNTYKDFESAIDLFTSRQPARKGFGCNNLPKVDSDREMRFDDAWKAANPTKNGFTFSNMPIPGLESRPDRILFMADDFDVRSAWLSGNGTSYRSRYFGQVTWSRLERVVGTSVDSYNGWRGRSCAHDCGPHASCRCGVCVAGGDRNACLVPDCGECSAVTFYTGIAFVVLGSFLTCQLLFGAVQLLLVVNERAAGRGRPSSACCGRLCLCDRLLYAGVSARLRRIKRHPLSRICPLLRLPPMILVVVSTLIIFMLIELALYTFGDSINDVYNIIPEELNPSDHLLLCAELDIRNAPL